MAAPASSAPTPCRATTSTSFNVRLPRTVKPRRHVNVLLGCRFSSTLFASACRHAKTAFAQFSFDARGNCATAASPRVRNMPLQPLFERRPQRHRVGAVPIGVHSVGASNPTCSVTPCSPMAERNHGRRLEHPVSRRLQALALAPTKPAPLGPKELSSG